jgi:multiple sugar transport system permease protein
MKGKSGNIKELLLFIIAFIIGITMVFPLFWMVSGSLKTDVEMMRVPPVWLPEQPVWSNYLEAWAMAPFVLYFRNSLIVATTNTVCVLFTSSLAGYIFARYQSRLMDVLFYIILGTMMIPSYLIIVPLFMSFVRLGFVDNFAGLFLPGTISAFGIFLLRQFIMSIPSDLFDAAEIDGCGVLGAYRHVTLPLCKPGMAALTIFTFTGNWDSLLWPLIITRSTQMRTLSVGIAAFQGMYFTRIPLVLAASTFALAPIIILYFLMQKQFIQGIALTGFK